MPQKCWNCLLFIFSLINWKQLNLPPSYLIAIRKILVLFWIFPPNMRLKASPMLIFPGYCCFFFLLLWCCQRPALPSAILCCSFDLVTNGGIAVALHFERAPFITQEHTLWLPWGRFFVMDTIVMRHEENDIPSCDLSSFTRPSPLVSPAPLTTFAGSCSERRSVVPEIQVINILLFIAQQVVSCMARPQMIYATHLRDSLATSDHVHV